jgi:catechol 2,3-dioxygenase-like lactoylglutathione lyase family enzyme
MREEINMDQSVPARNTASGPPKLRQFAHVSVPCRDLKEGIEFYSKVLGGEKTVETPTFASFKLGGVDVGIGSEGTSFITNGAEYPHMAFFVNAEELVAMKKWLTRCGVPTSNFWTRGGVETLMFFRDPSGNMIELFCLEGYAGADKLPRGPARGHGTAVDIDSLRYERWQVPD